MARSISEYAETFAFFDRDRDGQLTADELFECLKALSFVLDARDERAVRALVAKRHHGLLTWAAFVDVIGSAVEPREVSPTACKDALRTAFAADTAFAAAGCRPGSFAVPSTCSVRDLRRFMSLGAESHAETEESFLTLLRVVAPPPKGSVLPAVHKPEQRVELGKVLEVFDPQR
jgi:hypothetical protein